MIENMEPMRLFQVDVLRLQLDLPHGEIAQHCIDTVEKTDEYTSFFDKDFNNAFKKTMPHREQFERDIFKACDAYVKATPREPFSQHGGHKIDYWCSIYRERDQHGSHIHTRSLISGTYYPLAPTNCAPIALEAPWIERLMHDTFDTDYSVVNFTPKTGDCLIWPSWLNHRVMPQGKTDEPRIAISFNVDYANARL